MTNETQKGIVKQESENVIVERRMRTSDRCESETHKFDKAALRYAFDARPCTADCHSSPRRSYRNYSGGPSFFSVSSDDRGSGKATAEGAGNRSLWERQTLFVRSTSEPTCSGLAPA